MSIIFTFVRTDNYFEKLWGKVYNLSRLLLHYSAITNVSTSLLKIVNFFDNYYLNIDIVNIDNLVLI